MIAYHYPFSTTTILCHSQINIRAVDIRWARMGLAHPVLGTIYSIRCEMLQKAYLSPICPPGLKEQTTALKISILCDNKGKIAKIFFPVQ